MNTRQQHAFLCLTAHKHPLVTAAAAAAADLFERVENVVGHVVVDHGGRDEHLVEVGARRPHRLVDGATRAAATAACSTQQQRQSCKPSYTYWYMYM